MSVLSVLHPLSFPLDGSGSIALSFGLFRVSRATFCFLPGNGDMEAAGAWGSFCWLGPLE